ncbi:hypothetical protein OQA88_12420 [Cercophora sp. LCS_1]
MAPRPSQARQTIGPESEHLWDLGVVGRKTGVTRDKVVQDEHGMEDPDAFFSSPTKPNEGTRILHDDSEEESDNESSGSPMEITQNLGVGPAALLNGHGNRLTTMQLAKNRSPVKTFLNSPAQRNRLMARSSSPTRGDIVRDNGSGSGGKKQRPGASGLAQNGGRSASQPVLSKAPKFSPKSLGMRSNYNSRSSPEESEEELPKSDAAQDDEAEVDAYLEESMAMLQADIEEPAQGEEEEESEEEESEGEEEIPRFAASKKKPGPAAKKTASPKVREGLVKSTKSTKRGKALPESDQEDGEEEEEGSDASELVAAKPQRNAGKQKATPSPPNPRGRKRRSPEPEEPADHEEPPARQTKRPRASPASVPAPKPKGRPPKNKAVGPSKPEPKKRGRKRKSSEGDISIVAIPRGPPLPKSRGLLINRREVPGDSDSMVRTRSGRTSFKPLAFWRNERVDYDVDEEADAFAPRTQPHRFVLHKIKEVVRVDEPEAPPKKHASKRTGKPGRRRAYDDDDDLGPAEPWETNPGLVDGKVVAWHPDHELNPPGLDEEVDVEVRQLAISSRAVRTQTVKDASFRYAKVLSEGFFNAGVVDLPPGAEKRPKNARKMFMTFFVHTGRVLVTVNETSFRISKGGMWFVPRGNYYAIENESDVPARIFFSQGCEVAPQHEEEEEALPEGEEGYEDQEGEEEEEGEGEE